MKEDIINRIQRSIEVKQLLMKDDALLSKIDNSIVECIQCYKSGGKIFFCGNGGSAADAQHLASELSGKFYLDRNPLFAEALHVNTSHITAVANDYSFEEIYSRLIEAKGTKGDVLFALSTSGTSRNIVNALKKANEMQLSTIGLIGNNDSDIKEFCDIIISIPSGDTPRIQESQILIGHIICEMVEKALFGQSKIS